MISASEIVGTYRIIESIGIGAYTTNCITGEPVAIKKIDRHHERIKDIQKEVLTHQNLKNLNIIQFIESFEFSGSFYIVQELAEGGELFEQIEPDIGFPEQVAHFYFVQLIRSINYLHTIGVCHRDLKPENLLLDEIGNLKLADFGLSTLFRRGSSRRKLSTRCGTPAYMSPEISNAEDYEGDEADIWSCCVILIVLLTGNLPWENSGRSCSEFISYLKTHSNAKIDILPDGPKLIVQKILRINPLKRWTITDIISDPWYLQSNSLLDLKYMAADPEKLINLIRECSGTQILTKSIPIALTQPEQMPRQTFDVKSAVNGVYFSQPHSAIDSEINFSSSSRVFVRNSFARFLCNGTLEEVSRRLEDVLRSMLVPFQKSIHGNLIIYFQTVDRLKCPLVGQFSLHCLDNNVLIIIKKNRGNPIEYARFFKFIVDQCIDILY